MSIYSRLFTYRPRPKHTPLENFLTAALADLLNRLPRERRVSFIAEVLLKGAASAAWLSFIAGKPDACLEWVTQRGVREGPNAGVVDLLLLVDGRERLVVETKVGAAVRGHAAAADGDDDEQGVAVADASQLTTYGAWLAQRCQGHGWPGALVLLTHRSEPPRGYGPAGYGVPHVGTCRWREVWKWARAAGADGGSPVPGAWAQLSTEFAAFLETQGMSAEYVTQDDIAQAEVFVTAADRMQHTFNAVAERLRGINGEIGSGSITPVSYESVGAVAWAWFYLREPSKGRWYFAWGIRFPKTSRFWTEAELPLPSVPHAFVTLGAERRPVPPLADLEGGTLPEGWAKAGAHELVIGRKLSDLPTDADMLAVELANWVAASITALRPTLAKLVAAAGR